MPVIDMPFLTVADRKIFYAHRRPESQGQPPVVFIHGAGGNHQHWLYQVRELPNAATYAVDLPGHGRSEGAGLDSIPAYSDWLVSFLDAAGLAQVVLVGHSMGGGIALDVALRYPERVLGLGLVATGARLRVAPTILENIRQDFDGTIELICDFAYGPEIPSEVVLLGARQMAETSVDVFHGDFLACDAFDVMDRLEEISVPSAVVCGTEDRLTPPNYAAHLQRNIPGSKLHMVLGAGHMIMIEMPHSVVGPLAVLLYRIQQEQSAS